MASITYEWEKLRSSPQAMEVVGDRAGTGLWLSWSVLSRDTMSMLSFFSCIIFFPLLNFLKIRPESSLELTVLKSGKEA